jgi:hypothetical protein
MPKILLLGGPSGSGKSTFTSQYMNARNWLQLELDRWPEEDGPDFHHIRPEWDRFIHLRDPVPLYELLAERGAGSAGVVLSLSSRIVFSRDHLLAALGRLQIAYLYGPPDLCREAFLHSPKAIQLNLGPEHWDFHNLELFERLPGPENQHLLIHSFTTNGVRRDNEEIYNEIISLFAKAG